MGTAIPGFKFLGFFVWDSLKSKVYSVKIIDKNHVPQRVEDECHATEDDFVLNILRNLSHRLRKQFVITLQNKL